MKKLKKDALKKNAKKIIEDAGGMPVVAKHFDINHWSVNKWHMKGRIPQDRIVPLCALANDTRGDGYWDSTKLLGG